MLNSNIYYHSALINTTISQIKSVGKAFVAQIKEVN